MSESENGWKEYVKYAISAFVSITHIIAFFQIVICSRHLAVAFNIPPKNIGIYFPKLYSLRSLLMSMSCGIEYLIYRMVQIFCPNIVINIRRYLSMAWFALLTICEVSFLCVLYFSKRVAFHNYIVLNLEGMFFGFFQMSILSLIPEFAAYYMLSLYVSGTCIFIIQTVIDRCTKNSMLSVKIQSWICVLCSLICLGLWPVRLFVLKDSQASQTKNGASQSCSSGTTSPGTTSAITSSPSNGTGTNGAPGTPSGSPPAQTPGPTPSMAYVMSLTSMSILKIMINKFDEACQTLSPDSIVNVQILITRLQQIRVENQITYDVLVAIDLVILNLKKCSCPRGELILLAELSLFLRIKVLVKTELNEIVTVSHGHRSINGHGGLPVETLLHRYPGYPHHRYFVEREDSATRAKRSVEPPKKRVRRNSKPQEQESQNSGFFQQLLESLSQLMMFPIGSLVKDFLFPGVIPYGLLERDKCHLINLIVIIFLSVGPVTIFVLNRAIDGFKSDNKWIHMCWNFMIPKILILIISLCAIHTKRGPTHKIRSSQGTVLFMTVLLLTCYGFLETMSFVGMAYYVNFIGGKKYPDLQAIQNVFGKFFRYFVYKISVGYNKTRISAGFVLPNFKPPQPIPNTFCYWFKGAFSNGWKDIKGDFKMGIQQYLSVDQAVSKKSPLESLRYCDLLM